MNSCAQRFGMADVDMEKANEDCVGPSSEKAGKASGCEGCPNQKACALPHRRLRHAHAARRCLSATRAPQVPLARDGRRIPTSS